MARQATSPREVAQIARVYGLLADAGVTPSPDLLVTAADGKKFMGQLVQNFVANKPGRKCRPRVYFVVVTLATNDGNVQIDYLDIVWLQKLLPQTD